MTKCHTLLPEYRRIRMSFYQIRENYWLHWQNPRYDKCVSQYQCRETNVIMGTMIHNLWGESTIEDTIHVRDMQKENYPYTGDALTFKISPLSFYQVNPIQTEKLYSLALEYAGLTGKETVWDLYCGIGTISLFLAGKAKRCVAWRSSPRPSTMPERMQRETILKC